MPLTAFDVTPGGSLSLPKRDNISFRSSADIAPNYHVGPRMYNDAGFVPHPLQLTGNFFNNPAPDNRTIPASAYATDPAGVASSIAWVHPISINGRSIG